MKTLNKAIKEELVKDIFSGVVDALADTFTKVKVLSGESIDLLLNAGADEYALKDVTDWTLRSTGSYGNSPVHLEDEKGEKMIEFSVKQLPSICMVEAIISFIVEYCF